MHLCIGGPGKGFGTGSAAAGVHRADGAKDTPWLFGLVGISTPGLAPTFPEDPPRPYPQTLACFSPTVLCPGRALGQECPPPIHHAVRHVWEICPRTPTAPPPQRQESFKAVSSSLTVLTHGVMGVIVICLPALGHMFWDGGSVSAHLKWPGPQ